MVFCYVGTKTFTPCPQKIGFWAQKRPNLAKNWHFGPNIGIFGPFDLMPDQKTMQTSCLCGFLLCWYQNFYLLPEKLGCLADKRPNLAKNWFHAQPLNNNKYGSIVHSIHSKVITVQSFCFQFLQTLKLGYLLPLCQASRSSHSYSLVSPPAAPSCDIS